MAQQPTNPPSQGTAVTPSQQTPYNYNYNYNYGAHNYYLQAGYYNSTNYATNAGYYSTPSTNIVAYPLSYASYTPNYTLPAPHTLCATTGQDTNNSTEKTDQNTEQDMVLEGEQDIVQAVAVSVQSDDPSQAPHFWDDCEYINYTMGADSCDMCQEEVEDDTELQEHLKAQHHVVFFACTTCRTVFSNLNALHSHECHPYVPPEPPTTQPNIDQQTNKDKKRKRKPPTKPHPSPKPPAIIEKVRLNEFGAVYVPPQKRYLCSGCSENCVANCETNFAIKEVEKDPQCSCDTVSTPHNTPHNTTHNTLYNLHAILHETPCSSLYKFPFISHTSFTH